MQESAYMPITGVSGPASACSQTPPKDIEAVGQPGLADSDASLQTCAHLPACYIFDGEAAHAALSWFKLLLKEAEYSLHEAATIETFDCSPDQTSSMHPKTTDDHQAILPFAPSYCTVNNSLNYYPGI